MPLKRGKEKAGPEEQECWPLIDLTGKRMARSLVTGGAGFIGGCGKETPTGIIRARSWPVILRPPRTAPETCAWRQEPRRARGRTSRRPPVSRRTTARSSARLGWTLPPVLARRVSPGAGS